jgi:hypothetical protein
VPRLRDFFLSRRRETTKAGAKVGDHERVQTLANPNPGISNPETCSLRTTTPMATPATHIRRLFTPWRWWTSAEKQHPFDRRHRVDTGGLLYADRLATGHAHDGHNAGYYATAPSLFHGAIDLWRETLPATASTVSDYTLVDIGCGKGRVLMLASEYGFREIVGVELNRGLARVARKNLRKWLRRRVPHKSTCQTEPQETACQTEPQEAACQTERDKNACHPERDKNACHPEPQKNACHPERDKNACHPEPDKNACHPERDKNACHPERSRAQRDAVEGPAFVLGLGRSAQSPPIRIIEADALTVPFPACPAALFYFNSFERPMMEMWLSHLAELSRERTAPLDLIYIHPEFDRLVQQVPGVRVVAEAEIRFSDEDARADAFGVSSDQCSVYRWSGS